jgi:ribosome-associated protein
MDYVDFIVHVFSAEKRAFYGLERLRKSATTISVADLNAELKARISTTRAKTPKKTATDKGSAGAVTTPRKASASKKSVLKKVPSNAGPAKKALARTAAQKTPAKTIKKSAAKKMLSNKRRAI